MGEKGREKGGREKERGERGREGRGRETHRGERGGERGREEKGKEKVVSFLSLPLQLPQLIREVLLDASDIRQHKRHVRHSGWLEVRETRAIAGVVVRWIGGDTQKLNQT